MAVHFLVPLLCFLFLGTGTPASSASTTSLTTNTTADGSPARQAAGGGGNVTTFSFTTFHGDLRGANMTVVGDAAINGGALQITPDSLNDAADFLTNKSGRVLYSAPFRLWRDDKTTGNANKKVASFSAVFTVNVFRAPGTEPAEGFAFLIAPSADKPPAGSYGGFLGLTNASTDGNASNRIVAVELDTEKQPYDPDDNHIGLNVNSVVSVANVSLRPLGIEICPVKTAKYNVWIDYDGAARRIAVYMADIKQAKPASPVLASKLDLGATVAEKSYFGFSASTGRKYQLNCVLAWNMTVERIPWDADEPSKTSKGLTLGLVAVGVSVAVLAAAALGCYYLCVVRRRKAKSEEEGSAITGTMIRSLAGGPREFDYRELRKATNNFDERMKLGQGWVRSGVPRRGGGRPQQPEHRRDHGGGGGEEVLAGQLAGGERLPLRAQHHQPPPPQAPRPPRRVEPRQRRAPAGVRVHAQRQPGPAPVQLGGRVAPAAAARVGAPVRHRPGRGVGAALPARPVRPARGAP